MTATTIASTNIRMGREAETLERIVARLCLQFPELSADHIYRAVYGRYDDFEDSPIRDFVPILVERGARDDLKVGPPRYPA